MKLSIVDIAPVPPGGTQADALANTIDLARRVERLGYTRYWVAEHHGTAAIASHAPEVLIPAIAAATSRIRVGSGAVLLNHYSPFKVAEQFRTLHALFPGRIDMGIGRAFAGRVPEIVLQRHRTQRRPVDDYGEQVVELIAWVGQELPPEHAFSEAPILPDVPGAPEMWILGSSPSSPHVAAQLGLPYAFAGFISPEGALSALTTYRNEFQPSESEIVGSAKPRAILAVHVVCAETQAEAERLAMTVRSMYARLTRGELSRRLATPDEAIRELGGVIPAGEEAWPRFVIGDPAQVRTRLERMARDTGAEEIVIQDIILSHEARLRSYELLAQAFELSPSSPASA
ncbi:LLM class flavin-dependent oxidoreductase [Chondromyces apiculatus]|uniref:Luciferase-like monooxygenase n=1 Tax=Chondromyces apiculatus DSM 436 TaxID=1192034 RepID=A0A017T9S0_9BACT|nr:LLM class flavin-dependent oxidoreductase [Chondromyces apiculatus]EYF06018.1 alkanal monooxygenase-like protein [Chondromyces apiculatus DSM 436]